MPDSPEEIHHSDEHPEHPTVHREETDANFRAIFSLLLGAIVVAAVIYFGVTLFFYGWRAHETAAKKSPFPLAPTPTDVLPAGPRLDQIERMAGIDKLNANETLAAKEETLNKTGRTEDEKFVHIPIKRAMKMLENKLPARPEPIPDNGWRADGLVDSGESNSGRVFRGKPR